MADPGFSGGPEHYQTAHQCQRQGSDAAGVVQASGGEGTEKEMIIIMTKHAYAKVTGTFQLHKEIKDVASTMLTNHNITLYGKLGAPDLSSPQDIPEEDEDIENWFHVSYNATKGTHFIKFYMNSEPLEKIRQEGLSKFAKRKNILIKEDEGFKKPTRKKQRENQQQENQRATTIERPPEGHKSYAAAVGRTATNHQATVPGLEANRQDNSVEFRSVLESTQSRLKESERKIALLEEALELIQKENAAMIEMTAMSFQEKLKKMKGSIFQHLKKFGRDWNEEWQMRQEVMEDVLATRHKETLQQIKQMVQETLNDMTAQFCAKAYTTSQTTQEMKTTTKFEEGNENNNKIQSKTDNRKKEVSTADNTTKPVFTNNEEQKEPPNKKLGGAADNANDDTPKDRDEDEPRSPEDEDEEQSVPGPDHTDVSDSDEDAIDYDTRRSRDVAEAMEELEDDELEDHQEDPEGKGEGIKDILRSILKEHPELRTDEDVESMTREEAEREVSRLISTPGGYG